MKGVFYCKLIRRNSGLVLRCEGTSLFIGAFELGTAYFYGTLTTSCVHTQRFRYFILCLR